MDSTTQGKGAIYMYARSLGTDVTTTNEEICSKLYLSIASTMIDRIYERGLSRGFTPDKPICLDHHVDNAPRSGRPTKQTEEKKEEVEAKVTKD